MGEICKKKMTACCEKISEKAKRDEFDQELKDGGEKKNADEKRIWLKQK